MTPRSRKAKGRRLQNEVVDKIREIFGCHEDDCKPAIMGESGRDVKLSPAMQERFPYSVECKNTERIAIWQAIEQAERNANGLTWIVFFRRNRSKTFVVMPEEEFWALSKMRDWVRE